MQGRCPYVLGPICFGVSHKIINRVAGALDCWVQMQVLQVDMVKKHILLKLIKVLYKYVYEVEGIDELQSIVDTFHCGMQTSWNVF